MKLHIFGRELSPLNMERVKGEGQGGGILKYVGGLMDVVMAK